MPLAHQGHHLILDGHISDDWRVLDLPQHLLEEVAQVVFLLLATLTVVQALVEEIENCHKEVLVRNVDVQEHCERLEYSDCCEFVGGVALLYELKEDFVLELLRSRLAESNHILNQSEHIVELNLLADSDDNLKDFESLILVDLAHEGDALIQGTIFGHQNIFIIFGDSDEIGSLSKDSLEELINIEMNDLVEKFSWRLLNDEVAVLAVG